MPRNGRAVTGAVASAAVVVAVALVLLLALRAPGSGDATAAVAPSVSAGPDRFPADGPHAAAPAPTRTLVRADPLAGAVARYAASRSGPVIAAVYDVTTGQSWHLGAGPAQAEASVIKLDILETLLARKGYPGLSATDKALARLMIEESDNDAATSLWDKDGGASGLTAYGKRAGLTRTTPSQCVVCAGFPWPGWGLSTTVPADQLTLLKELVAPGPHPLLGRAARGYALSLLKHVSADQRWGVSGGVPAGVSVALKDGWLPLNDADTDWQINSVGWIDGAGRDYLIAVLSTGNPTEQYGIDTINALSGLIWSALRLAAGRLQLAGLVLGEAVVGGDRAPQRDEGVLIGG